MDNIKNIYNNHKHNNSHIINKNTTHKKLELDYSFNINPPLNICLESLIIQANHELQQTNKSGIDVAKCMLTALLVGDIDKYAYLYDIADLKNNITYFSKGMHKLLYYLFKYDQLDTGFSIENLEQLVFNQFELWIDELNQKMKILMPNIHKSHIQGIHFKDNKLVFASYDKDYQKVQVAIIDILKIKLRARLLYQNEYLYLEIRTALIFFTDRLLNHELICAYKITQLNKNNQNKLISDNELFNSINSNMFLQALYDFYCSHITFSLKNMRYSSIHTPSKDLDKLETINRIQQSFEKQIHALYYIPSNELCCFNSMQICPQIKQNALEQTHKFLTTISTSNVKQLINTMINFYECSNDSAKQDILNAIKWQIIASLSNKPDTIYLSKEIYDTINFIYIIMYNEESEERSKNYHDNNNHHQRFSTSFCNLLKLINLIE